MLQKRLGAVSPELEEMIGALSAEQADALADNLFDITSEAELRRFLSVAH